MENKAKNEKKAQGVSNSPKETTKKTADQIKAERKLSRYSIVNEVSFKVQFTEDGDYDEAANDVSDAAFIEEYEGRNVPLVLEIVTHDQQVKSINVNMDKKRLKRLGYEDLQAMVGCYVQMVDAVVVKAGQKYPQEWFKDEALVAYKKEPFVAKVEKTYCNTLTIINPKVIEMLQNKL